ncbi:MAG: hypothetical protein GX488_01495 [Clostridiales bacterium]|nr:hypothetical protein [Clostridiales bacterium]
MKNTYAAEKKLNELYEDTLFALLMDKFSSFEGQRLIEENEILKNSKDFKLPDGLEERCKKAINSAFAAKKRGKTKEKIRSMLGRASVFVLFC